ncbi:MAG: YgfZ/GcvT domain-containing protein [Methylocella sp.]|nr:MAG: folate-binding protein [Hyphomicrobiales bacterium]
MDELVCLLGDRGIIEVGGADATGFLQRLITNSVLNIPKGEGRYAGLLTPQGKLLFDFFVVPLPEGPEAGYLIDCAGEQTAELVKRLNLHKMRAKIAIEDKSEKFAVAAFFGGEEAVSIEGLIYRDTRAPHMGQRVIAPRGDALAKLNCADAPRYEAHRIAQGVPKGAVDFVHGDAFVHDMNLDLMNGVDFKKGCYVGQEVVARVHYRNSARKRIVKIHFDGPAPAQGTQIMAGETNIGQVGSTAGVEGLAMVRLDRLEDARAACLALNAGDMAVDITLPG